MLIAIAIAEEIWGLGRGCRYRSSQNPGITKIVLTPIWYLARIIWYLAEIAISLPALQHIIKHEKSFVTFYMDAHFSKSLHDFYNAWQSSSSFRFHFSTSSHLQFFDLLCSFSFLFNSNLSLQCSHFCRILLSSPLLHWGWQTWAGYWHCVIVQLFTLGCWDSLLEGGTTTRRRLVSWVWNRILQRDLKNIFIKISGIFRAMSLSRLIGFCGAHNFKNFGPSSSTSP